jgi:hypothetical protein
MSRWISEFQNHAFQKPWKDLMDLSSNTTLQDETITTDVQELARFKKGVSYINNLLNAADPEFIPKNIWNDFNEHTVKALEHLQNYNTAKDINFLIQANEKLDYLLTSIKPYIISDHSSAQAAINAFLSYSATVDKHINQVKVNINDNVKEIKNNIKHSATALKNILENQQRIQEFEKDLIVGDENKISLKSEIQALLKAGNEKQASINEFHKKLTSGNEYETAIMLQIEKAKDNATENSNLIKDMVKASEKPIQDLKEFCVFIFGHENEHNIDSIEGGLKQFLDNKVIEINQLKEEHARTYQENLKQIESLLPGATSAGLATAYHDLKNSFNIPVKMYSALFFVSIILIFSLSVFFLTKEIGWYYIVFIDISEPRGVLSHILYKLPLLLPIVWLALFSSKRRSESHRLLQEYAHKEANIKSYENFKKQIEDL